MPIDIVWAVCICITVHINDHLSSIIILWTQWDGSLTVVPGKLNRDGTLDLEVVLDSSWKVIRSVEHPLQFSSVDFLMQHES